eukprot:1249122-Prymnesium_polylepis.2
MRASSKHKYMYEDVREQREMRHEYRRTQPMGFDGYNITYHYTHSPQGSEAWERLESQEHASLDPLARPSQVDSQTSAHSRAVGESLGEPDDDETVGERLIALASRRRLQLVTPP